MDKYEKKGNSEGHYQEKSMYAKSVREQNKMQPCLKAEGAKSHGANKQEPARSANKMKKGK